MRICDAPCVRLQLWLFGTASALLERKFYARHPRTYLMLMLTGAMLITTSSLLLAHFVGAAPHAPAPPRALALPLSFYVLTRACAVEGAAPAPPKHLVIVKGMVHVQLRLLPYIALLLTAATYGPTHARACLLGIVAALLVESALRIKRWPIPPICRTPFLPYLRM